MAETRKLAAILVADVVGFSRLAGADEERLLARLRAQRSDLIDPTIAVHKGRVVKRTGERGDRRVQERRRRGALRHRSPGRDGRAQRRLDDESPTHFRAPSGTAAPIDYAAEAGPAIALRVQELFGLAEHPAVAGGRIPLTLQLLSPAHRPIQITGDLPGFWRGSCAQVRADLPGRYPRHFWPEDRAGAAPTTRAKPRG